MSIGKSKKKMQRILDNIEAFEIVLPMCSYCKLVRDKKGNWHELEVYICNQKISSKTCLGFSHVICEKCFKEKFPEYLD